MIRLSRAALAYLGGSLLLAALLAAVVSHALTLTLLSEAGSGSGTLAFIAFFVLGVGINISIFALIAARHARAESQRSEDARVAAAQLETRVAQLQLENLRAQLCPHFLFNALNAASALVTSDPEGAERMISQISELLRIALRTEGVQEVPFSYELWFADRYLAVEKVRFGERLRVSYDIDDDARDALVPNFLLQPIVENAVHHGISPRPGPGHLEIGAHRVADTLRITVKDDGRGLTGGFTARAGGIGLKHTRGRLEYLFGADGFTFELKPIPAGGVCAEVCVPFRVRTANQNTDISALELAADYAGDLPARAVS